MKHLDPQPVSAIRRARSGAGRVKARRFMRRAYRQKRGEARRITDREILAGIIREAKALSDKGQPS